MFKILNKSFYEDNDIRYKYMCYRPSVSLDIQWIDSRLVLKRSTLEKKCLVGTSPLDTSKLTWGNCRYDGKCMYIKMHKALGISTQPKQKGHV